MAPQHHIHISTEFMVVLGLIIVTVVAIVLAMRARRRRIDREHEIALARIKAGNVGRSPPAASSGSSGVSSGARYSSSGSASFAYPTYPHSQPVAPQPAPVNNSSDMLTGIIIGEAVSGGFGGRTETIIERDAPAAGYASSSDTSSSDTGGFSYDSGSSSSDTGSSSSDSGSSSSGGGFDASW